MGLHLRVSVEMGREQGRVLDGDESFLGAGAGGGEGDVGGVSFGHGDNCGIKDSFLECCRPDFCFVMGFVV